MLLSVQVTRANTNEEEAIQNERQEQMGPDEIEEPHHFHVEVDAIPYIEDEFLGDYNPGDTSWIPENPVPVSTIEGQIENLNGFEDDVEIQDDEAVEDDIELQDDEAGKDDIPSEEDSRRPHVDKNPQIKTSMENGYRRKFGEGDDPVNIPEAMNAFDRAAALGHAPAITELGIIFDTLMNDEKKATEFYKRGAQLGDITAKALLGRRYGFGIGVEKNCDKAYEIFLEVCDSILDDVILAQRTTDMLEIHPHFNSDGSYVSPNEIVWDNYHSQLGDAESSFRMARRYIFGENGVDENYDVAHDYYLEQAALGDSAANSNLGFMYLNGVGVEKNYTKALDYFNKSANANDPSGINGMGIMYSYGYGVPKNDTKSFEYFELASRQDNEDGLFNTGLMYRSGTGVRRDPAKAFDYIKRAVDVGNYKAPYTLAVMYYEGEGVPRSCEDANDALSIIVDKGSWVKHVEKGFERFHQGQYEKALMHYIHAEAFGLYTPAVNAAFLYGRLANKLQEGVHKPAHSRQVLLVSEGKGYQVCAVPVDENILGFRVPMENPDPLEDPPNLNEMVGIDLLRRSCALYEKSTWAATPEVLIPLGDCYYHDWALMMDHNKAFKLYLQAAEKGSGEGMRNVGLMYENGEGVEEDFAMANYWYSKLKGTDLTGYIVGTISQVSIRMKGGESAYESFIFIAQSIIESNNGPFFVIVFVISFTLNVALLNLLVPFLRRFLA